MANSHSDDPMPDIDKAITPDCLAIIAQYSNGMVDQPCVLSHTLEPDEADYSYVFKENKNNEEHKDLNDVSLLYINKDNNTRQPIPLTPSQLKQFADEFKLSERIHVLDDAALARVRYITGHHHNGSRYNSNLSLFRNIQYDMLQKAAEDILNGSTDEDKPVCIQIVEQNPSLLQEVVEAVDPLGRRVKGTLLQIAAMAGDVNLQNGISKQKEKGLVERLVEVSNLSPGEVVNQLEVISSAKAVKANEERNQRVLKAIIAFGEGILSISKEYKGNNFAEFQKQCRSLIDQLEKDLTPDLNEVIRSGYIFDPTILEEAALWFDKKFYRFDGWGSIQSDIFWVNGFGKLQSKLSSRDAHVIIAGFYDLLDLKRVPKRSLRNSDGLSYFYNSVSRLGVDFYLIYHGGGRPPANGRGAAPRGARFSMAMPLMGGGWLDVRHLMSRKKSSVANLIAHSKKSMCSIL